MKKIFNPLIILQLLLAFCGIEKVYTQQPVQQWVRLYDDSLHEQDINSGMVIDKNSNVFVTGTTLNGTYFTTIKYSTSGVQQWISSYPGNPGFVSGV